jgi:hypothetical protein
MQQFKPPRQARDLLSAQAFIHGHFHPAGTCLPSGLIAPVVLRLSTSGGRRHMLKMLLNPYKKKARGFSLAGKN